MRKIDPSSYSYQLRYCRSHAYFFKLLHDFDIEKENKKWQHEVSSIRNLYHWRIYLQKQMACNSTSSHKSLNCEWICDNFVSNERSNPKNSKITKRNTSTIRFFSRLFIIHRYSHSFHATYYWYRVFFNWLFYSIRLIVEVFQTIFAAVCLLIYVIAYSDCLGPYGIHECYFWTS